jgi:hypothetical protein
MFARFLELQRTGVEPTNRDESWINNQRMDFKPGRMLPERAVRFRKVGYDFNSNQRDEAWQKRYVEYCEYVRKTGDRYGHKAPKPLRSWMSIQRREYRANKLSEDRIKLLEAVGFLWEHPTTSYLNPARLKQLETTHGENLGGEVRRVHDGWQALTIDQKRWLAQNGVTFNQLFTRNAEPLDILKGNLAQHPEGFAFNTAGEMLTRVEAALSGP